VSGRREGVALVSGAASGIGAAVVDRLRDDGMAVVGCDIAAVEDGVVCDVTDAESCHAAVAETLGRHGRLDVLANVAGIIAPNPIAAITPDEWRRVIEVNLTGTFLLSQAALPALLETRGAIVNMASLSGIQGAVYQAAYCASKGGVIMLTKSMAIELARSGVRVNAVCPNAVDTPLLRNIELPEDADVGLVMRSASPMGPVIEPSEIAAAVAYLASDDAANVTGTTLVIDGGASA